MTVTKLQEWDVINKKQAEVACKDSSIWLSSISEFGRTKGNLKDAEGVAAQEAVRKGYDKDVASAKAGFKNAFEEV